MSYVKTYTIEIGGVSRKYTKIEYETKLENTTPTRFDATIEFDTDYAYFDLVEIKCNGTTEWKGFLEDYAIDWDSNGRYIKVGGRDTDVLRWKVWCENFTDMHSNTGGFFGQVNATELIKFVMRRPKSDLGLEYSNNKSGWGIDAGKIRCSAIIASPSTREQSGDPNYTVLRRNGYGWRNSGSPFNNITADVDAVISNNWSTNGASPYLHDNDGTNYIYSKTSGQIGIFSFENLSTLAPTATLVTSCRLNVTWRPEASWWIGTNAIVSVYVSTDGGTNWSFAGRFTGKGSVFGPVVWNTYSYDISGVVSSVTEADALRVKFVCDPNVQLYAYITHCSVSFNYVTAGNQQLGDEFDIVFPQDIIMGIYFESRFDNQSYPRNYGLLSVTNNDQDYTTYEETDPNTHISKTALHIDFDAYQNEDAYVYKDLSAGNIGLYFDHWLTVKVVTDPFQSGRIVGIWAATNDVDDYVGLASGSRNNLALSIQYNGTPVFYLREVNNGTIYLSSQSAELIEGNTYLIRIVRRADKLTAYIYNENETLFDALELTMVGGSNTFRYLFGCLTANNSNAYNTDVDIEHLMFESYESLGFTNNNTYRDVIYTWTPQELSHIRIRISDSASFPWAISQLYIYRCEDIDYRLMYEGGTLPSFALDQYIQDISIDTTYTTPVGPLNIPKGRILDIINNIVKMCNDDYISYENWLEFNSDNTLHISSQRGSDKHLTVSFVKGTHIGKVKKECTIAESAQRVQVIGRGEGKRQDDVSSDWQIDTVEMANVHTFYEDVVTDKTIADKRGQAIDDNDDIIKKVADLMAKIYLSQKSSARESIEVTVNNDEDYDVGAYEVGDYVTITDALTGTSGSQRIYNIRKTVTEDGGVPVLNVNAPRIVKEEIWKDIYNKIKQLGIVGTLAADWGGEALNEEKVSAEKALSTLFEKTAKNDVIDAKKDIQDPSWYIAPQPTTYTAPVNHKDGVGGVAVAPIYTCDYGMKWSASDAWMKFTGPTSTSDVHTLLVENRMRDAEGKVINVPLTDNPKLMAELKLIKKTGVDAVDWYEGDYFDIGLYDSATLKGYILRIIKQSGLLYAYARWNNTGDADDWHESLLREINISDIEGDGENFRYKLEIITEKDNRLVIFNLYDVSPDNPVIETYPPSVIVTNIDVNVLVKPLYMLMSANQNSSASNLCQVYIYNIKTEVERVK